MNFVELIKNIKDNDFKQFGVLIGLGSPFIGCEDTSLVLNWEKCHFMVNEGIVLEYLCI